LDEKRPKTKLVPVPSKSIIPERNLGKPPIMEVLRLGIDFGGLTAVDDFNLTLSHTEIAGLIGPNGAGKTRFSTFSPRFTSRRAERSCFTEKIRTA